MAAALQSSTASLRACEGERQSNGRRRSRNEFQQLRVQVSNQNERRKERPQSVAGIHVSKDNFCISERHHGCHIQRSGRCLGQAKFDDWSSRTDSSCLTGKSRPCLCAASVGDNAKDDTMSSDDAQSAALKIEQLQAELERAIRLEDYNVAAQLRDRLRLLQENDEAAVLAANALFYRAFAAADLRLMHRVWVKGDHVQCLHPGANCISGYDMVMASWEAVLGSARDFRISLEDVIVHINGPMAVVTCVEVIRGAGSSGRVAATNIFEKRDQEWRMFLHHGSQVPAAMFV